MVFMMNAASTRSPCGAARANAGMHATLGLLLACGLLVPGLAFGQERLPSDEYAKQIKSAEVVGALGPDLFGEQVNLYTGTTEFTATDVDLRGNNALRVAVGRRFLVKASNYRDEHNAFGSWELDIPHLQGIFHDTWRAEGKTARCSRPHGPGAVLFQGNIFDQHEYWSGNSLYVPGQGTQDILAADSRNQRPTDGSNYVWATRGQWYFSCIPARLGGGEGFLARAPDGTRYWFDWLVTRPTSTMTLPGPESRVTSKAPIRPNAIPGNTITRREVWILPTRVEDRFGNAVTYTYDGTDPWRLTEISATDGRRITLAYNASGQVSTVSSGTRIWRYGYSGGGLTQVVLPDGRQWTISMASQGEMITAENSCGAVRLIYPSLSTTSITHPSGARGEFKFLETLHGRSYAARSCRGNPPYASADFAKTYAVVALRQKTLTGPGLPTQQWNYTYAAPTGSFSDECAAGCPVTKAVEVSGPGNHWTRYTFGIKFQDNEGKLLQVETGTGPGNILRRESTVYALVPGSQPYPASVGYNPYRRSDRTEERLTPVLQRQIAQQNTTFTWQANAFDVFANPTSVTRSSSLGYSRTDVTSYFHDTAKWVIGQIASSTNNNTGQIASQVGYDSLAQPVWNKAFGKLQQTLTYNADGSLATVKDGNNNVTILSSWKRGIPQLIQFPATPDQPSGAAKSAVVNDNGWISSMTDENGFTTNYSYDTMGRLASIAYPTGDSTAWTTTTLNFAPSASPVYGLPAGHWRQTIQTGNARTVTMFDALWRPVVKETYDAANLNGTLAQTVTRYDANGRTAFVSFPQRNLDPAVYTTWADPSRAPNALGTRMDYDALNRVTAVKQDSELGMLTSTTQYLAGFQTRTTNPRGQSTTTRYLALDQPTDDLPVAIAAPEGTYTDIVRDVFGKPTAITRRDANNTLALTRYWMYDAAQQLCKTVEPETGTSLFDYDAAGNLIRQTIGIPFTYPSPCASAAGLQGPNSSPLTQAPDIRRSYDARNRVKTLVFPDGRGDTTYTYTPDSLPASVTTNNAPGGEQVINTYAYNRRRMMTGESMTQSGWYSWGIGYGYDGIGNLSTQTYPDGSTVFYAPNALGQATQVKDHSNYVFASGAQYYPNGALMQLTYGNGLTHVMTQNVRQLPQRSTDSGGVLDHEYVYDPNANVQYIYDQRNPADHRYLYYDGLNRLTSAGSQMFGGDHWHRFTYDVLDNLKSWKLAGVKDYANYYYDANNRLTNIQTSAGASVVGLGYDAQGNLSNKNGQNYTFNYGNWLREVTGKEYFRYDGHGRRIMAWSPTLGSIFSQYTSDGKLFYQEDQRSGNKRLYHLFLGGNLVAIREVSTAAGLVTRYQHTDALGSPVAVSNEVGVVVERNNYEPYGAIIGKPGYDGIGYTGHVMDAATGLTYMQQRYYDPAIGRFLSVDPVTADTNTGSNFNRYKYAANNPYRFTDPDGRQEYAAEKFGDSYGSWTAAERVPFEAVAVPVAIVAVALTPIVGPTAATALRLGVRAAEQPKITSRPDITLSGGRSGEKVKTLEGPADSAVKGGNGRVFVTNDKGQVVKDITKDRVKDVTPGKGFGDKRVPTKEETKLIDDVWKKN